MAMSSSATDYPIEANVKKDITYNFGAYTGTLESTDPGIANVVTGTNYIIESVNKTGTRIDTNPRRENVKAGTIYYINSIGYVGSYTCDYPIAADVKKDVSYSSGALIGELESTDPGVENVEKDIVYYINSSEKTGSRLDTDPGIANVRMDTTYYIDSVLLTGALTADLPTQGTLTALDNGNETTTITISGTDAGNTSNVYIRNTIHGSWETSSFATITGNDSSTKDISAGDYELKIVTENASGNQICGARDPVSLHVSNPDKSIQYFNVLKVLGNPGEGKKRLLLEARTQPINPQTPTV